MQRNKHFFYILVQFIVALFSIGMDQRKKNQETIYVKYKEWSNNMYCVAVYWSINYKLLNNSVGQKVFYLFCEKHMKFLQKNEF